jgi:hypothetical protein
MFTFKNTEIIYVKCCEQSLQSIPVSVNGQTVKSNNDEMSVVVTGNTSDGENTQHKLINDNCKSKKHTISIIGDSHARACSSKVKDNLSDNFDITCFVKPGTGIETLTSTVKGDIKNLTGNDV